jgi:tetratricopeptide (TPR) repeat protein
MKRNLKCFAFILSLFILWNFTVPAFGQKEREIDLETLRSYELAGQMFEKGKQLFTGEEFDQAEATLSQCVDIFPRYTEAHYYLARLYYRTGDFNRACVHIKKALTDAGFMVSLLAVIQEDYLNRLKGEREKLQAKLNDAFEQVEVDRLKKNITVIDEWLKEPPPKLEKITENYLYWLGNILLKMQKYNDAREQYLETIRLNPANGDAYVGLAVVSTLLRKYEKAKEYGAKAESLQGREIPGLKDIILTGSVSEGDIFTLFSSLMGSAEQNSEPSREIQTFVSLYTKFYNRPQLLTPDVLLSLYVNYDSYNVMIDFIEKIPVQKPDSVLKLMDLAKAAASTPNKNDKVLFTSIFQSLLELIATTARYSPDLFDYDTVIEKLCAIPLDRRSLYVNIFNFLGSELNVRSGQRDLIALVLSGLYERAVSINNVEYRYLPGGEFRENIEAILQSQETCSFGNLMRINRSLDTLVRKEAGASAMDRAAEIIQLLGTLPIAEISSDAPKHIRDQVMPYSRKSLNKVAEYLMKHVNKNDFGEQFKLLVNMIHSDYLLPQLNHYMLTLVYALNAKNPKLRVFLNPNISRLHDFSESKDRTPWNYCGAPQPFDFLAEYRLSGGLSRLNIAFAAKWQDHLFSRSFIYSGPHVQALIINLLDLYPLPVSSRIEQTVMYDASMVEFGLELLRKAKSDPTLCQEVISRLGTVTSGYNYRRAVNHLEGKSPEHTLFFSEIKKLGESFFYDRKHIDLCDCDKLSLDKDYHHGGIYYRTLGSLKPQPLEFFPQEVSHVFDTGWISGEIVDEFSVRLAWLLYKKKIPVSLMGHIAYSYLTNTIPRLLSQNHGNDHYAAYFAFYIFNNAQVNKIVKDMQRQGYLKLK